MPATPEQRRAFGALIRSTRKAKGLTVQQVVDGLRSQDDSLSVSKVSAWERGEYAPASGASIDMIEDYFDLGGQLHDRLGSIPPSADRVDDLAARVAAIEAHLGLNNVTPIRRRPTEDLDAVAAQGDASKRFEARKSPRKRRPSPPVENDQP